MRLQFAQMTVACTDTLAVPEIVIRTPTAAHVVALGALARIDGAVPCDHDAATDRHATRWARCRRMGQVTERASGGGYNGTGHSRDVGDPGRTSRSGWPGRARRTCRPGGACRS